MVLIKPFLEELSSKLSLKNKVIFLGFVSELEKLELLNLADIYVLASLREGLPFSLLEAVSTDCICLATPVEDVGRVIVEKQNGFLLEPMLVSGYILCSDLFLFRNLAYSIYRNILDKMLKNELTVQINFLLRWMGF